MKSLERDWLVFQLRVTKVAAIATGNTWMFSTWGEGVSRRASSTPC